MRSATSGLTTRQFERESADLSVEFVVGAEHRGQVCFSSTSAATDAHAIAGRLRDVSSGGMGLILDGFVPRLCEGTVRVFSPFPSGGGPEDDPVYDVIFEHEVKVRRVTMHDRRPSYSIGVAFYDPEPNIEDRVQNLLGVIDQAREQQDAPEAGLQDHDSEDRADA